MLLGLPLRLIRNLLRVLFLPIAYLRRRRAGRLDGYVHVLAKGGLRDLSLPVPDLPWAKPSGLSLQRFRSLVDALLDDPRPRGLLLTLHPMVASAAHRTALRREILRLRDGGKHVVVHLPLGGGSGELLIASAASRVVLGASTVLGPLGFATQALYAKKALEKLGVVPDVMHQGDFKTAGEGLYRDSMSEPQREQVGRLLDTFHGELVDALASGRGLDREEAIAVIDRGLITAKSAIPMRIADAIAHDDEILHLLGAERSEKPAITQPAGDYLARRTSPYFLSILQKPLVGVIEIHGGIVEGEKGPTGFAAAGEVVSLLEGAAKNPQIVGVLLHVDSPGGGVLASAKIHRAVERLALEKPVVAQFAGVAASGGYYVAAPCHAIVAESTTITGSIGVVAARIVLAPLLERLGITPEVLTRGARADLMNITRPYDDEERAVLDGFLAESYDEFVSIVAKGRNKPKEDILPLAGGRVWSGADALDRGLVDRLGGLGVAMEEVTKRLPPGKAAATPILLAPKLSLLRRLLPPLPGLSLRGLFLRFLASENLELPGTSFPR
jgi:protease IV